MTDITLTEPMLLKENLQNVKRKAKGFMLLSLLFGCAALMTWPLHRNEGQPTSTMASELWATAIGRLANPMPSQFALQPQMSSSAALLGRKPDIHRERLSPVQGNRVKSNPPTGPVVYLQDQVRKHNLGRPGGKKTPIKPLEEISSLDDLPEHFKKFQERFQKLEGGKGIVALEEYSIMWRANQRKGLASTKTRAEVRGGGKKPYQQKGSGRARRGSSRSPLIRGGGVIFGPKPKSWRIQMNVKAKRLAFERAIFESIVSGRMEMIKPIGNYITEGKTKEAFELIKQYVPPEPANPRFVLVVSQDELTETLRRAEGNLQQLTVFPADTICAYDVIRADKLLITRQGLKKVMERFGIYKNEADIPPKPLSQAEKLLQVATAPMYVKEGEEEPKSMFKHPKGPVGRKIKGEGWGFHGVYRKGSKGFKGWMQFFRRKDGDIWKNNHMSGTGKKR